MLKIEKTKTIPAPLGEEVEVTSGVFLPVKEYIVLPSFEQPLPVIETVSDYEWQLKCLKDRLENPEKYFENGEDVNAVIKKLQKWFENNKKEN